jgi:hypothetical protein
MVADVGMPFGYPRISIPGPVHYESGQVQGLEKIDLETKKGNSSTYSTRTLVKPSLVAYIKPGRGAPREISENLDTTTHSLQDRLDIYNSAYGGSL